MVCLRIGFYSVVSERESIILTMMDVKRNSTSNTVSLMFLLHAFQVARLITNVVDLFVTDFFPVHK